MQIAEWNVENLWMHTQVSISEFKIPSNLSQLSDKESFVCMERGKSYTRLARHLIGDREFSAGAPNEEYIGVNNAYRQKSL